MQDAPVSPKMNANTHTTLIELKDFMLLLFPDSILKDSVLG
jgi:hypothetical protein